MTKILITGSSGFLGSIPPFKDGNGKLARILFDMLLARGEKSKY